MKRGAPGADGYADAGVRQPGPDSQLPPGETPETLVQKRGGQVSMGRPAWPEEIANAALFLLSDEASYITGWHCRWMAGYGGELRGRMPVSRFVGLGREGRTEVGELMGLGASDQWWRARGGSSTSLPVLDFPGAEVTVGPPFQDVRTGCAQMLQGKGHRC